MLFNSLAFLTFFLLFLPSYWFIQKNLPLRNILILTGSYFFYGSWDWRFLSLIFISTLVDFYCGRAMHRSSEQRTRKLLLITSITVNIGILATFKYFDFFITGFIDLLSIFSINASYYTLQIILPVGISFYTFQTLTYSIDIYNKRLKPTNNFINFAAFVAFFPQLVAGPIERAKALLPQIERTTLFNFTQFREGCFLVIWGLFKKVLIADRLAVYVDAVFSSPESFTTEQYIIAVFFFAIQIYCDFSGYSDIARGIAKMLGFELMVNFNTPYFAKSLRDFWQRWHISLSTWFRDYVFVPLGGSRTTAWKIKRNLMVTFLISGFWHGANYTFIIWGFLHALGYFIDPFSKPEKRKDSRTATITKHIVGAITVFIFVNITWIFFRATNLDDARLILGHILSYPFHFSITEIPDLSQIIVAMSSTEFYLCIYFIICLIIIDLLITNRGIDKFSNTISTPFRWVLSWFFIFNLLVFSPSNTGSFIYFQF